MLKNALGVKKVVVACGRTDLRLGIDGLVSLIRFKYGMNPLEGGTLFLFCGRKRDRIKGVIWDEDGYCLLLKRLTRGVYQWPRNSDEALALDKDAFRRLMEGFTITSTIPIP